MDHLLKHGVNAIFANGSMGAFALLSDQEQARAVEIVIDEVNGRCGAGIWGGFEVALSSFGYL